MEKKKSPTSKIKTKNKKAPPLLKDWEENLTVKSAGDYPIPDFSIKKKKYAIEYPSPKKDKIFKDRWDNYIEDIAERENFKKGHLFQLELLCDLYVELKDMSDIIKEEGYTYLSESRNGTQIKPRPEVLQRNRILSEIRNYSKMLGLLLVKDTKFTDDEEGEQNWS